MRRIQIIALAGLIAACSPGTSAQNDAEEAVEAAPVVSEWRAVAPENLIILELESGEVVIELNDDFAPNHAAQMREFISDGIYDGEAFYRVIDGFVAQGGLEDDARVSVYPTLLNENDRELTDGAFAPLGNDDLFTSLVGHVDGFAVAKDEEMGREWLLHCPGAMAMARDTDPDSGSTEFYIVLDAQRYLDRNLTVFARVISGMEHIQALQRGDMAVAGGVIQPPDVGDTILSMTLVSTLPEDERPQWEVMKTPSEAFEAFKTAKRVRTDPFFYRKPPEILDICSFATPAREVE